MLALGRGKWAAWRALLMSHSLVAYPQLPHTVMVTRVDSIVVDEE